MMMMLGLYTAPPSAGGTLLLDATPFVLSAMASTNEHGFEALPAMIRRPLAEAIGFFHQSGTLYAGLFKNGSIVWEGRLEDPSLVSGAQGSGIGVQALGAWRALSDDRYTALWSTTSVSEFVNGTSDMGVPAYANAERWQRDINNRLFITLVKGNTYAVNQRSSLLMSIPHLSTREIVGIQFSLEINLPATHTWRCVSHPNDISSSNIGTVTAEATLAGTAALVNRAYHIILASPQPTVGIEVLCNTGMTYAGETSDSYAKVTNLRIVSSSTNRVNTTLTANRNAGTNVTATVGSTSGMYVGMQLVMNGGNNPSEIVTVLSIGSSTQFNATFVANYVNTNTVQGFRVLADEIVKDVVSQIGTLNSSQLSSSTTLIQSPGLDLNDETFEDAMPADVLTHLAELGDNQTPPRQWEVGVYEGRILHFRPRSSAARAWYVDVTDLQVARTLDDVSNSVYATYADSNGRTLRTTNSTDSTSTARYSLTRRSGIAADTTSSVQAGVQRDAQLADHKDPLPRATVVFPAVYDASGGRYPLWMVRSGDTVTIRNLPPSTSTSVDRVRTFRISHTLYNLFDRTLEIELEVPPARLATLLARRAEGIKR